MNAVLDVIYYRRAQGDPQKRERLFVLQSRASFQLAYAQRDFGFHVARAYPDTPPGEYPVTLTWSELIPELSLRLPDGSVVRRRYPQSALRGDELLAQRSPERAAEADFYLATPSKAEGDRANGRRRFSVDRSDSDLKVVVPDFPTAAAPVPLEDYLQVGGAFSYATDLPVVCSPDLLRAIAEEEREWSGETWTERGMFLVGRVVRDPVSRGLVTLVDDVVRPAARGTVGSLTWEPEARAELSNELERRRRDGECWLRSVGWVHTHHLGELARTGELADSVGDDRQDPSSVTDGRFFSAADKKAHKTFHDPASVGIVLDAPTALTRPDDLARCFAVFGTLQAAIVRRGIYLGEPSEVTLQEAVDDRESQQRRQHSTEPTGPHP